MEKQGRKTPPMRPGRKTLPRDLKEQLLETAQRAGRKERKKLALKHKTNYITGN